jgi:3-oxoacyl-[acyl-carrier-protein] synthase III
MQKLTEFASFKQGMTTDTSTVAVFEFAGVVGAEASSRVVEFTSAVFLWIFHHGCGAVNTPATGRVSSQ